jgi:ubiquinone/menaquinone biosynthesis C-methylase UbiE
MWQDYEASYRAAIHDSEFLAWRELGARRKARNIVQVCQGIERTSLVEIGCGTGAVLRVLQAMRFAQTYCCIDISFSAVGFAAGSCRDFTPWAVVGRADALPFPDGEFSVAVLSHVIEHLEDPLSALREASRIARFVVVEVPTEKVFLNFLKRKILFRPYASIAEAGHVQFWSPASIARFLTQDADMEILNQGVDLLDDDSNSIGTSRGAKVTVKRTLRSALPGSLYSRLLTTHATFLCRGSNGTSQHGH